MHFALALLHHGSAAELNIMSCQDECCAHGATVLSFDVMERFRGTCSALLMSWELRAQGTKHAAVNVVHARAHVLLVRTHA
jgi:hypothetical protein